MTMLVSKILKEMFDRNAKNQRIFEEAQKKDSGIVLLQHDKKTGDMAYIQKHPRSPDHIIYSNTIEGSRADAVLHRRHVEEMIKMFANDKKDKK